MVNACCAALLMVASACCAAHGQALAPGSAIPGKTTEQQFKNIQVLKGLPAEQLIPAMQFITASLGVECGFCHVRDHFDQDDKKPKQTARKMMQMMAAINANNFESHRIVTCNTCHRGSRLPVGIPAISDQPRMAQMASEGEELPPNLPSVNQVLEKYVQASGGAASIGKITSRIERGSATFMGHDVDVEVYDKQPGKRTVVTHLPDGESATIFDGQQGWLAAPRRPVMPIPSAEIAAVKWEADLQFPLHIEGSMGELHPAAPEKIGDKDTYQILAGTPAQPKARLFFDQQSGLLVRMIRYSDSPLGFNPTRIDYADYRAVDGVQVPYRWTTSRPAGRMTIQIKDVQQNVPVDEAKFARPNNPEATAGKPQ